MPNIGPMELVIVLVIALLILGPKRLPEAGRSLGRGMREFKDSIRAAEPDARTELAQPEIKPSDGRASPSGRIRTPTTSQVHHAPLDTPRPAARHSPHSPRARRR